jgi:NitT/TauT family transport system permease protein
MSLEERRDSTAGLVFSYQTLVSVLVLATAWEALSYLAPVLGIPPFAVPGLGRIAQSFSVITPSDIAVTLASSAR